MKRFLRTAVLIAGMLPVLRLLASLWSNFQLWRANVHSDPSVAELYSDGCLIDGGLALFLLALTLALFFVLGLKTAELGDGSA
jgi:hypothetical protein